VSTDEARLAEEGGWLVRQGVQFHWHNREPEPYASFEDLLASLQRDKRKKVQQERRKVREAGVTFDVLEGSEERRVGKGCRSRGSPYSLKRNREG